MELEFYPNIFKNILDLEKKQVKTYLMEIYSNIHKRYGKFGTLNIYNFINLPYFISEKLILRMKINEEDIITSEQFLNFILPLYFPTVNEIIELVFDLITENNSDMITKTDILFLIKYISYHNKTNSDKIINEFNNTFIVQDISKSEFVYYCENNNQLLILINEFISSRISQVKHVPIFFYEFVKLKKFSTFKADSYLNIETLSADIKCGNSMGMPDIRKIDDKLINNCPVSKKLSRANCIVKPVISDYIDDKQVDTFKIKNDFYLEMVCDFEGYIYIKPKYTNLEKKIIRLIERDIYLFNINDNKLSKLYHMPKSKIYHSSERHFNNKNYFGLEIKFTKEKFKLFYFENEIERNKVYSLLNEKLNYRNLEDYYTLDKGTYIKSDIENFTYGIDNKTNLKVTIKIYKKRSMPSEKFLNIYRQIEILKIINHVSILKLFDTFEDNDNIYLITDYFECKTLREYVYHKTHVSEHRAYLIISQIIDILEYLHNLGIIHRDLNYNNIIITELDNSILVKISELDNAKIIYPLQSCTNYINNICNAPEIINESPHDFKVDVWSIGILLYFILSQNLPFTENCESYDINNINSKFEEKDWHGRSQSCKKLIQKCIEIDCSKRYSLKELKDDIWFSNFRN